MPQFEMNGAEAPVRALDSFTQGYIEALFWTETEPGTIRQDDVDESEADPAIRHLRFWNPEIDSSLPGDVGFSDLAPETLQAIIGDCRDFQESNADNLELAYLSESVNYDESRAGHDFWLTRNGHGAGFWDRGLGTVGDQLTKMAKPYGSSDAYLGDDGRIYVT